MAEGKGRCDLVPLDVAAVMMQDLIITEIASFVQTGEVLYLYNAINRFEEKICMEMPSLILELAQHFEAGAKKYGENNWKKGLPIHCYIDSGVRHYLKWLRGDDDEPHHRAFVWNIVCCIWTCVHKPELNEYGSKTKDEPNTNEWGEIEAGKEVDDALYAVDSAKAAPKTYEQDFLEKFPNAPRDSDGLFEDCRNDIYGNFANRCTGDCVECWNEVMPNE